MKLLPDTHILLWAAGQPEKLSESTRYPSGSAVQVARWGRAASPTACETGPTSKTPPRLFYNLDRINWLTETPSSADLITISRCFSEGTLSVKCPRNFLVPNG